MRHWKTACLAGMLLAGCEFGSEDGPDPAIRLWLFPREDEPPPLPSDTLSLAIDGDSLEFYRRWNGCHHLQSTGRLSEFLRASSVTSEIVPGPAGDSLRLVYVRDTGVGTGALGELRADCLSREPMGSIEVLSSDFDSGTYGLGDSLRIVLRYRYIPQAGYDLDYFLNLSFFDTAAGYGVPGGSDTLETPEGMARIAVAADRIPGNWREGQPLGYVASIAFARSPGRSDFIHSMGYRPIKAAYRAVP